MQTINQQISSHLGLLLQQKKLQRNQIDLWSTIWLYSNTIYRFYHINFLSFLIFLDGGGLLISFLGLYAEYSVQFWIYSLYYAVEICLLGFRVSAWVKWIITCRAAEFVWRTLWIILWECVLIISLPCSQQYSACHICFQTFLNNFNLFLRNICIGELIIHVEYFLFWMRFNVVIAGLSKESHSVIDGCCAVVTISTCWHHSSISVFNSTSLGRQYFFICWARSLFLQCFTSCYRRFHFFRQILFIKLLFFCGIITFVDGGLLPTKCFLPLQYWLTTISSITIVFQHCHLLSWFQLVRLNVQFNFDDISMRNTHQSQDFIEFGLC